MLGGELRRRFVDRPAELPPVVVEVVEVGLPVRLRFGKRLLELWQQQKEESGRGQKTKTKCYPTFIKHEHYRYNRLRSSVRLFYGFRWRIKIHRRANRDPVRECVC